MKVILTSKIKTLGDIGDVRTVADGYGKNYLFPNKFAIIYSEKNNASFKDQKDSLEKLDNENKESSAAFQKKIENKEIIILENAGDNDRLYGSVNSLRIANFVNELVKSKDLDKSKIKIVDPIKYLGKHEIIFELHPDIIFSKEIIVARSKEEAEKIKKSAKTKKDEQKVAEALNKVESKIEVKVEDKIEEEIAEAIEQ